MLELFQNLITTLTGNATLIAIVPATSIFTGPVDMVLTTQTSLTYPCIVLSLVSESFRTVPVNARDSLIQVDIWSRNSQLELENIYEAVVAALAYNSADQGQAHIFWQKPSGAIDSFETDRRVWHRAVTLQAWSEKP